MGGGRSARSAWIRPSSGKSSRTALTYQPVALFTTLRVRSGEALFWRDHVARLGVASEPLLRQVAEAVAGMDDARVRITLRPPQPPLIEASAYEPPRKPWRLVPVTVSLAGDAPLLKTTDRRRYDEARARAGTADDALLVGPQGHVLETTITNVFFSLPGGGIVTPPRAGILPGIARARLLGTAVETQVTLEMAAEATACAVTNAVLLTHPVASIHGVKDFDSEALARDLREAVDRTGPHLRIIQR